MKGYENERRDSLIHTLLCSFIHTNLKLQPFTEDVGEEKGGYQLQVVLCN